MRRTLTAATLVAGLALVFVNPAQADDHVCRGTVGARVVHGNLVVPRGATCTLEGTRVRGNVAVEQRGTLIAHTAQVSGHVQSDGFAMITLDSHSRVDGRLQLRSGGAFVITSSALGTGIQVENNNGPSEISSNRVGGNVDVRDNTGGLVISSNRIDGSLKCAGNRPAPTGVNNRATGGKEGQCRSL